MLFPDVQTPIQTITHSLVESKGVKLFIKREDLIHEHISGNKWRKLKYNLIEAKKQRKTKLLTFGGAYSNHIAGVAAAGSEFEFETVGIIRGEEHEPLNPTLQFATELGMKLVYVNRNEYREFKNGEGVSGMKEWSDHYIIPEGGANELGVKGCEEILNNVDIPFDVVCCPCGTGTTLAGLVRSLGGQQKAIGFPVVKNGGFLRSQIEMYVENDSNWKLSLDYHFGGFAKITDELVAFVSEFKQEQDITLDLIYTGKMMFGILAMIEKSYFVSGTRILAIHTGGLQGNKGFADRFGIELT